MNKVIRVFAPATVANVSCGFDVLGFAVDWPGDEVEVRITDKPGIVIEDIIGDGGQLPLHPGQNTVSVAIARMIESIDFKKGISLRLEKKMPLGSGLGSSAASAAAGVFALNQLLENPVTDRELVEFAVEGERLACGSAHADNVAPAIMGGFVLIRSYDPLDVIRIPTPSDFHCVIIHPQIEIRTRDARDILRKEITLQVATRQWGNVAGLIAGLFQGDHALISRSMVDHVVEPVRSILIPGFDRVKQAALSEGALGCGISGSGPSLFALCRSTDEGNKIAKSMQKVFSELGIDSEAYVSAINTEGPKVITRN